MDLRLNHAFHHVCGGQAWKIMCVWSLLNLHHGRNKARLERDEMDDLEWLWSPHNRMGDELSPLESFPENLLQGHCLGRPDQLVLWPLGYASVSYRRIVGRCKRGQEFCAWLRLLAHAGRLSNDRMVPRSLRGEVLPVGRAGVVELHPRRVAEKLAGADGVMGLLSDF